MSNTLARAGFFDISPTCNPSRTNGHGKENDALVPVLSLVQFSRSPFVSFGTVKLESSRSLPLCIENPTEDAAITVTVDKIPSSRGFSVDQTTFTIPPEDRVIITVTWTPVEEGGVRELLSFIANGIVKHQAILHGKAEGAKTKKKSLWDTIKSKGVPSLGGKVGSVPIKAANKTFRVSRQPQYKRNGASNPLTSLNQERTSQRRISSKEKNSQSVYPVIPQALPKAIYDDLESTSSQNKSPVVLLVPADRFLDAMDKENISSVPLKKVDYKESRVLNKTLSPIGTPERFSNPLMPRFQSPLPVISKPIKDGNSESKTQILSVKDALAVINSDLSCPVSPPNACSSLNLADSLESDDLSVDGKLETAINVVGDISPQTDITQPRLTFFVKANTVLGDEPGSEDLVHSPAACSASDNKFYNGVGDDELKQESLKPKKILFNSATVIKSKAGASPEHSPNMHKTRTFRRRLLQKAPLVSPGPESNTDLLEGVSLLPVINSDACVNLKCSVTPPQESEQKLMAQRLAFPDQPPSTTCAAVQPILTLNDENRILPFRVSEDMFPVHSRTTNQNRKRKSDEYLRDNVECLEVKQSSDETQEHKKSCYEKQFSSKSKQTQRKITVASSSRKSTKVPTQKPNPKSTQKGGQSLKSFSSSKVKTARVMAVAQTRLNFIKPTQTDIPRHPLPFAAKNMFYDERWIEKQERGFTWWMNYVLTPDDFKVATEVTKVNALSLTMGSEKINIPKAPTKEEMSFRTYTARRHLNRVRRAACQLFTSDKMVKAIKRLEVEVEAKRLLIRKDRHLWKDIGERQKVLNWLLSYNPLWLRIGLETIFGELISLESNSDIMGLAMFILGRLLWNPDIAAEFRHSKVPHLYRDGHEETLSRFTLKKLLLLVCFLDKAKESRLIEHDPCLFCMDAEFKTSKDLLLAFSRDFLSGEGILPRHLGLLGLAVSHVQTPLDEFNFAVQNLATDLRCGIRLVRIMEVFTQDWSLSRKLRMPAISRLQKVHNVDVALQVLREKGVDLRDDHGNVIDPRDIVDGHREKTLNLLWRIIFSFQVEILLDVEQLKEEISFLKRTWRTKQKLRSLRDDKYVLKSVKEKTTLEQPSEKLTLLLDWVNAVCCFYRLKAENFTVSFSDGRILCYLIHHYHPSHLRAEDVQQETTQTIECDLHSKLELNNSSSDSDYSFDSLEQKGSVSPTVDFKMLLENERRNFQLVSLAVSYLGGVPAMITPEDMSNTIPNEKVVTCYLSFLCTRLLDLRNETRAARVIQSAWRRYKLQKDIRINRLRNQAAKKIQALVRCFIQKKRLNRQNMAATVIQAIWRGHLAREELRRIKEAKRFAMQERAAVLIQKTYREWRTQIFLKKNHAAVVIQTAFRIWHARKMTLRNSAAVKIQAWYRMQQCRKQYLTKKSKAVFIQAWFRGNHQRRKFQTLKKHHQSAVVIQSVFRAFLVRKHISEMRQAAIFIQMWYKACLLRKREQKHFAEIKSAAVRLQAAFRGWKARREISKRHQAALLIQTAYRRFVAQRSFLSLKKSVVIVQRKYRAKRDGEQLRSKYLSLKCAAIKIQASWRGTAERKRINQLHQYATVIQSHFRRHVVQTKFMALKQAALVIQKQYKYFKMTKEKRSEFLAVKKAVIVLQSAYRGMRVRQDMAKKSKAATLIQSAVRAFIGRKNFLAQRGAAIVLQQHYRAYVLGQLERQHYIQLKKSTITLQAICRGCKVRRELKKRHHAATVIQAHFRMYKAQVCYIAVKCAATIIQQRYRAYVLGRKTCASYLRIKTATVTIQSTFRGMKVRRNLKNMHQAATVIQACVRGHLQLVEYRRQKWAASIIQRQFRANKQRDIVEKQYIAMKEAALCIQSAYRGMKLRKWISEMQVAAKVIQRKYRTHKQHKEYQALKQAAVFVQRRYRANLLADRQRERYRAMQKAAITLQAAYRGMRVRREIQKRHRAATVIQASYKMYRVRMSFQAMRIAAILIQRQYLLYKERKRFLSIRAAVKLCQQKYRAILASRQQRKAYLEKYNAVLAIQAGYRGMKVRQQMQVKHKAAITIQSHVRKHINQKYYQRLLWASRIVQRCYRANKMRKQAIESFKKKRAAVVLQAAFRGMKARQALTQKHQACIVIQSAYRAHCARTRYLCMKYAVIAIQQRFRSVLAARSQREQFLRLRCAAVTIQANYRGHSVRKEMILRHQASTIIQAAFRRHREQTKYQAMRLSTIIIQRHYRSFVETKAVREKYLALKKCAIRLQAAYRGHTVRQNMIKMHNAATVIQAAVKMHKQRLMFRRQQWAAKVLQERFKAWKLGYQQRQRYQHLKDATLCLQKSFRGKQGRELVKRIKAVRTIQSYVRMSIQRRRFMKIKTAAVTIQCAYREHYRRVQQSRMQKAALLIQQWYRSCRLVQEEQKKFRRIQKATLTLQNALRQMLTRRLEKSRLAAIKIQSVLRMHLHRSRYVKLRSCAVKLQANYRMRTARRSYLRYQAAAVTIQTYYRAYRAKLEQRHHYLRTLDCISALQARVRGFIAYRRFQKMRASAVKIQACYRGLVERRKFQQRKKSACVIQKHYRAYQLCQRERAWFLKLRKSALLIQTAFRAYRSRKLNMQRQAALKIQAWFRGCQARRAYVSKQTAVATIHRCLQTRFQRLRFQAIQHSVRVIQQRWRETLIARKQRAEFLRIRKSVVIVQALWRAARVRRSIQKANEAARRHRFAAAAYHHLCAVRIQRVLRAHWALKAAKRQISSVIYIQRWFLARLQRKRYLEQRQKIVMVQKAVRAWLDRRNQAATLIQHAAKRFLLRCRKERLQHGIIKFQALWRGHRSRKLHDTSKVISIRHRLQKVNREAKEEDKLCHKTTTALNYLLGYQNYAYILTALKHLETATRLSPESCEHLVNSGATHTIFTLIRSCNRSVPSMEIITLAIQVLLNLSKYNKTIDAVYDVEDSVETLLDLLQMYREKAGDKVADKGGSIFTKACFLLVILVQDEVRALGVKKLPKASDRICRIYKLMLQKCKMDAQRTKVKQRMNVSLNGSFLPQATPQKSKPVLRFVPDWVLERKKMKNIVDPLSAIQALVKSLAIVP
ncbi:abnormal spindle-like microcephaly-associated protein isoform X1 [Pangasianodon hypophthalmus]|uniref:abnormal spindle-like microcephaly-associated protein isoform X1 n=1 Tax=Pangasianodon hypophthalmus TaxID=310915 RepID=UPI0023081436|nr:abnormal spindle-like microcephaly-associated protein isoform X1 [Pangasianodon hypophthalmus]